MQSHEVNGFVDKILVNSLRNCVREIINQNDIKLDYILTEKGISK